MCNTLIWEQRFAVLKSAEELLQLMRSFEKLPSIFCTRYYRVGFYFFFPLFNFKIYPLSTSLLELETLEARVSWSKTQVHLILLQINPNLESQTSTGNCSFLEIFETPTGSNGTSNAWWHPIITKTWNFNPRRNCDILKCVVLFQLMEKISLENCPGTWGVGFCLEQHLH